MIKITFPDLSVKEFENGVTANQIATSISPSLAKKCFIAKLNDELIDLNSPILHNGKIELITGGTSGYESVLNHSCAHLLAQAIRELYPNAMFGVGPAIEEGFYYDIDLGDVKITEEDLPKIEKKMQALVAAAEPIVRKEVSKAEALEMFKNDVYKEELINELESYKDKFINAMEDDLNTADAVSAIFELSKFINTNVNETSSLEFAKMCLDKFNELTGVLNIVNKKNDDILDKDIEELIQKRADAKKNKDFKLADEIRQELLDKGIVLEDTRQGTKWKRV